MEGKTPKWLVSIVSTVIGVMSATLLWSASLQSPNPDLSILDHVEDIVLPALMASVFGAPAAILLGWPFHIGLYKFRIRNAVAYGLAGALAGYVGSVVILGNVAHGLAWQATGMGAIAAYVAWLIRRPDRDVDE